MATHGGRYFSANALIEQLSWNKLATIALQKHRLEDGV